MSNILISWSKKNHHSIWMHRCRLKNKLDKQLTDIRRLYYAATAATGYNSKIWFRANLSYGVILILIRCLVRLGITFNFHHFESYTFKNKCSLSLCEKDNFLPERMICNTNFKNKTSIFVFWKCLQQLHWKICPHTKTWN